MSRLEQVLYASEQILELPKAREPYKVTDLEQLSVIVLYTGDIKYRNFKSSWGRSFNADLYIKKTSFGELHVHCTKNGTVTGAKLNGKPISNYEAAMLDLLPGKSLYKKGFGKW